MWTRRALSESSAFQVRTVGLSGPTRWLAAGWRDLMSCPIPGMLHGVAVAVFGSVLFWVARERFWLLAGAFTGFLLVAPVLATGLYAISRGLARSERCGLRTVLLAWQPTDRRLVRFGLLLAFAGTGWVVTSAALITAFAPAPVLNPHDFIHLVVLSRNNLLFEFWLLLGGILAAPMFASSVVALPLLLDQPTGVFAAVLTSWRCILVNPAPMALWAGVLLVLTLAGMLTAMLGLLIVVPWLGHASWHAYRDMVLETPDPSGH
jgi:uncharacterized membrane protein